MTKADPSESTSIPRQVDAAARDRATAPTSSRFRPQHDQATTPPQGVPGLQGTPESPASPPRRARLPRPSVRPVLLGSDLLAVLGGLATLLAIGPAGASSLRGTALFGAIMLVAFAAGGLHRSRLSLALLDDLPQMTGRWLAAAALCILVQVPWSATPDARAVVSWTFLWGAGVIGALVILLRAVVYALVRRLRRTGAVAHRTLIVGAGRVGADVAAVLQAHPEYGLAPVGFLDDDPPGHAELLPLPLLGGPGSLQRLLAPGDVRAVVVAFSAMRESEMVRLIRTADRFRCELFVIPRLFELHQVEPAMDHAWGFPLVRLRRSTYRSRAWRLKRVTDVLVSGSALLFMSPLLLALALAVRIDGGPGVLFRQERVGVDGRHFEVLKFRSLKPATSDESATTWNISQDSRLTRLGSFLRATSLDELPQLYNVLRGDMSLVGPRPERPYFVALFQDSYPSYDARHRVPSGLTGLAQVHGLRGDTSIAERVRFDNYYIENWSLWLDVKIILRTFAALVRGEGSR